MSQLMNSCCTVYRYRMCFVQVRVLLLYILVTNGFCDIFRIYVYMTQVLRTKYGCGLRSIRSTAVLYDIVSRKHSRQAPQPAEGGWREKIKKTSCLLSLCDLPSVCDKRWLVYPRAQQEGLLVDWCSEPTTDGMKTLTHTNRHCTWVFYNTDCSTAVVFCCPFPFVLPPRKHCKTITYSYSSTSSTCTTRSMLVENRLYTKFVSTAVCTSMYIINEVFKRNQVQRYCTSRHTAATPHACELLVTH